jgi:tyrosine-protein kinase Etk/Wzc
MSTEGTNPAAQPVNEAEGTMLLDFLGLVARHRKLILAGPVIAGVVAGVISLLLPKWYTATTKIMPPQQSQSNAVAILGQLGALAGGAASQALGIKNPSDIYVSMLRSRTIADALVDRFELKQVYDEEFIAEARKELARNSTIVAGREGVITIEFEDKDPVRAAKVANAFVDELRNRTLNLAVGEAGQRRLFFEGQLKKAKQDLTVAEVELKRFTQDAGLVNPQSQVGLSIAAAAALRAQVSAKEIQLSAMRSYATENNPELTRIQSELSGLRVQLARMESDTGAGKGDVMIPFGKAPEVALEYTRRFRDLKYNETLYEVFAKQYEIARIDEAKDATLIQVLDVAIAPEQRSRPKRTLIVLVSVVLALLVAVLAAIAIEAVGRALLDPTKAARIRELRSLVFWR